MRTLTVALVAAAGLATAAVASAAPISPAVKVSSMGALQQAQYYPGWHHRWHRPWFHYRHYPFHRWWDRYGGWSYSQAEELNREELQSLGIAP